jgi:hypothetical protein
MKRAVACLAVALVGLLAAQAAADCCNDCGCQCDCCKVCRCVPTTKKVTKICYGCECEDFCVPGPSKICGYKCPEPDPCGCTCGGALFQQLHDHFHYLHKEPIWQPTCAEVRTRSRLVKKEVVKEVPSWKWEVVDLCPHCKAGCAKNDQNQGTVQQAPAQGGTDDYYSQGDTKAMQPVAAPVVTGVPAYQETELVSHNAVTKVKRMFLPTASAK